MPTFTLLDCNNFYVSCERAFNPGLEKRPVVVLSNNDGCIISRSNEVKQLGLPMGAPFYQWKKFCKDHRIAVFSSNYELYADMSQRVMNTIREYCPDMEVYSIDEAFMTMDKNDLYDHMVNLKAIIRKHTNIPVSIGFAPTKTLAKIANHIAKKQTTTGVFDLRQKATQDEILQQFPLADIWGIGRQLSARLYKLFGMTTAKQLRDVDPKHLRAHSSVVMEKIINELRGIACLALEAVQARKQIISSRSFSKLVTNLDELEEAVSHYCAIACEKLRGQKSVARAVGVFIETNPFKEDEPQYANSVTVLLPIPTADSRFIIQFAKKGLHRIYRENYKYRKAGIMLLNLQSKSILQHDLLTPQHYHKSEVLMKTVDEINQLMGRNTIHTCAEGLRQEWKIKFSRRSPRYTTRWHELLKVKT